MYTRRLVAERFITARLSNPADTRTPEQIADAMIALEEYVRGRFDEIEAATVAGQGSLF